MKISVENLGPVTHADFDLKPLTVFIGDNRQGKTQTLVASTAMLGTRGMDVYTYHHLKHKSPIPEIEKLYNDLTNSSRAQINLEKWATSFLPSYYTCLEKLIPGNLPKILGYSFPFEKTVVTLTPSETDIQQIITEIRNMEIHFVKPESIINIIKERDDPHLYLYLNLQNNKQETSLPKSAIIGILLGILLPLIINPSPLYFPSDRAGIISLIAEFQKNTEQDPTLRPLKNDKNETTPYPLALCKHLRMVRKILSTGNTTKRKEANTQEFISLLTAITQDEVILSSPEPQIYRKIQTKVNGTTIDVPGSSSGVKGLIGLSLYLQYRCKPGDFLVIDEPEQNLHPNQQAAIIELITFLVNHDIRVAITTHSPYIIEHLQNLISAHDLTDRKEIVDCLYLKREDSLIDKKNVGVYLFKNGTAENILNEDGEINWQTFCDTANTISGISLLIYDQQEKQNQRKTPAMSDPADEPKEG